MKSPIGRAAPPRSAPVAVILGSDSDRGPMQGCLDTLRNLGVPYVLRIISAHRAPHLLEKFARKADKHHAVIIAAAGGAAHLAGAIAARTFVPVIGVPLVTAPLGGLDALCSTVQMPPGVPVATVAVGEWGAPNAAILAAEILALSDRAIRKALRTHRAKLARAVAAKDREAVEHT